MSKTTHPSTISGLRAQLAVMQAQRGKLQDRVNEADREERRLSEANCRFQLELHNMRIQYQAMIQALVDCQVVRKALYDRIGELELSARSRS